MADLFDTVVEKFGSIAGKWTACAAFTSFLVYSLGYLTLRFQLTTFGLAIDLDLFDEKYLFAGCRFLVYLVASIPSILILVILLTVIGYVPYRLVPTRIKERVGQSIAVWSARPFNLSILGIVIAVLLIQLVMRKCFEFGNLLLLTDPPRGWITSVLLSSDLGLALFFSGLVAGTLLTAWIAWQSFTRRDSMPPAARSFLALLIFLVLVEFLLLPVNYGVLISSQQLARAEPAGDVELADGRRAWIVWDTKENLTYFVLGPSDRRMLLTVRRKESPVGIVAYDDIFCVLFSRDHALRRPCSR